MKTLIGKEGYLFLINDTNKELEQHCNNIDFIKDTTLSKYNNVNNFLLIVYPDKSVILNNYLPDGYNAIYRPALNIYKNILKEKILDSYDYLKNEHDIYYKTDTHINLKGNIIVLNIFIEKINILYGFKIPPVNIQINKKITDGNGDLTTFKNLQDMDISKLNLNDIYFYNNDIINFYPDFKITSDSTIRFLNYNLVDETIKLQDESKCANWDILSKYIIYNINHKSTYKKKIIIFYDSFLLSIIPFLFDIFYEIYLIKNVFNEKMINKIGYDYVFEFRAERFLN